MPEPQPRRLPRGRHALAREEVRRIQRARLCRAMAEVMAEKGYVATSVADVLQRATVSRQSFYELFDSKLDCFMTAFAGAGEILLERLSADVGVARGAAAPGTSADRLDLCERVIGAYLRALAAELPYARLFLVEVYAAGPDAIDRRARTQEIIAGALADLLGAADESVRFACRTIVAATSAMVTPPVAEQDADALLALGPPLIEHVRTLWSAGVLTAGEPAGP